MNKEFVPYEEAIAMKELGFDEPCLAWYGSEEIFEISGRYKNSTHTVGYCVSAPTFSQAFRWFREKHKLDSYIEDVFTLGTLCYIFVINGNEDTVLKHHAKNTYEEAQLDCLNELIKMVKEPNMFDEYGNLKDELK